jgi:hypothetical protein
LLFPSLNSLTDRQAMPAHDSTNPPLPPSALASEPIEDGFSQGSRAVANGIRERRRTFAVIAMTVAETVVFMSIVFVGWHYYGEWRLGRVVLTTNGPALVAQILAEATDKPIGERFSIGPHTPLALPAGDYRLRVQGRGLMSQTYRAAFNRGETQTHHRPRNVRSCPRHPRPTSFAARRSALGAPAPVGRSR